MKSIPLNILSDILIGLKDGLSYREIQKQYGASKSTVARISERLSQAGLSAQEAISLDEVELQALFYPPREKTLIEPDWQKNHNKLQQRKVTLLLMYEDYEQQAEGLGHIYTYSSFCRRYNDWKRINGISSLSGNSDRKPAEKIEVDFAGDQLQWVDSFGEIHSAKLFVATLPYSCMMFAEAFDNERQSSWLDGITDALEYFGGSPEVLVMDNAKALIKTTDWREGIPQAAVLSLCHYYHMQPWACKPATPQQKNRVEAAVGDAERWIIAALTLNGYPLAKDLADLNELILQKVHQINDQPFRAYGYNSSRRLRFDSDEKSFLKPLPPLPYERSEWKVLTVDKAHCVRLYCDGGHRYSVPACYTHKKVCVRLCRDKLEIYDNDTNQFITEHERHYNINGFKTHLKPEHLTEAEKHYRRSKQDWITAYANRGIPRSLAQRFVETLWNKSEFSGARVCGAVFKLLKTYTASELAQAMDRALEVGEIRYHNVKAWCEKFAFASRTNRELDYNGPDPRYMTAAHENVRNDYE